MIALNYSLDKGNLTLCFWEELLLDSALKEEFSSRILFQRSQDQITSSEAQLRNLYGI